MPDIADDHLEPDPRFRLKPVPLVVFVLLGGGLPYLAAYCAYGTSLILPTPSPDGPELPWLYMQHSYQLLFALIAIFLVKRLVPADYGLHLPPAKAYYLPAILWGLAFGVLMTLVDYAPQLWAHRAPMLGYPLNTRNVLGWLSFEGIYVGPTEEIPLRALLVTYLAATMPGRLRLGGYAMNWAGVIAAVLFALLHVSSFWYESWPLALGQQFYAFALGVLYAYWLEKSRSIMAPILGHNISDVTEYAILFCWVGLSMH